MSFRKALLDAIRMGPMETIPSRPGISIQVINPGEVTMRVQPMDMIFTYRLAPSDARALAKALNDCADVADRRASDC